MCHFMHHYFGVSLTTGSLTASTGCWSFLLHYRVAVDILTTRRRNSCSQPSGAKRGLLHSALCPFQNPLLLCGPRLGRASVVASSDQPVSFGFDFTVRRTLAALEENAQTLAILRAKYTRIQGTSLWPRNVLLQHTNT